MGQTIKKWDTMGHVPKSGTWDRQDKTMGHLSQKTGTFVLMTSKNGTTLGQCPKKWDMGQTGHYLIIYNCVCPLREQGLDKQSLRASLSRPRRLILFEAVDEFLDFVV